MGKKPTMKRNTVAKKRERSVSRLQSEFEELGVTHLEVDNPDTHFNRARSSSRARPVKKMSVEEGTRGISARPRSQSGIRDASQGAKLDKMKKKHDKKVFAKMGKAGESDRKIMKRNQNICSLAREALARLTEDKENLNNLKFVEISIICYYSCRF